MKQDYHSYQTCHFYLLGCTGGDYVRHIIQSIDPLSAPTTEQNRREHLLHKK